MPSRTLRPSLFSILLICGAVASACSPAAPTTPSRSGGSGGANTSSGGNGGTSSAGTGGQTSGAGTGGSVPISTGGTSGGNANGGASGSGSGGTASTGSGGSAGTGGSSGGATDAATSEAGATDTGSLPMPAGARPAKPSAGCGKANPPTGSRPITSGGTAAKYTVVLPPGYDGMKVWPMGFAFHGYGLNEATCAAGSECPGFKTLPAITVYMKSIGAGWEGGALAGNVKFFEDVVAAMKADYCVDENRIFVAGVSSGGQFVEHLSCRFGDWLWAVSPIAAYVDAGVNVGCKGTPPQVIIHGITDNLDRNGHAVRDLFAKRNGCPTVPADMAKAEADMLAARMATRAEYRCLDYAGCTNGAVRWCVFSQVTYNNLTHGFPKVGGTLIGEFLGTLK